MSKQTPLAQKEIEKSPMITWGKIEGTPTFLGLNSKTDNFKI